MDLDRFRKILGMLGSEHGGERSAAALKATAMLKEAGLTWENVTAGQAGPSFTEVVMWRQQAEMWKRFLDDERARTTHMANDMLRMKREIDRLKGIWPNGKPPRASKKPVEVDLDWRKSMKGE